MELTSHREVFPAPLEKSASSGDGNQTIIVMYRELMLIVTCVMLDTDNGIKCERYNPTFE